MTNFPFVDLLSSQKTYNKAIFKWQVIKIHIRVQMYQLAGESSVLF